MADRGGAGELDEIGGEVDIECGADEAEEFARDRAVAASIAMAHETEPSELGIDDGGGRPHEHIGTREIARRDQHDTRTGRGRRRKGVVDIAGMNHRDVREQGTYRGCAERNDTCGSEADGGVEAAREFLVDGPCAVGASDFKQGSVGSHDGDVSGAARGQGGAEDVTEHRSGQGGAFGGGGQRDGQPGLRKRELLGGDKNDTHGGSL